MGNAPLSGLNSQPRATLDAVRVGANLWILRGHPRAAPRRQHRCLCIPRCVYMYGVLVKPTTGSHCGCCRDAAWGGKHIQGANPPAAAEVASAHPSCAGCCNNTRQDVPRIAAKPERTHKAGNGTRDTPPRCFSQATPQCLALSHMHLCQPPHTVRSTCHRQQRMGPLLPARSMVSPGPPSSSPLCPMLRVAHGARGRTISGKQCICCSAQLMEPLPTSPLPGCQHDDVLHMVVHQPHEGVFEMHRCPADCSVTA
jgi:hypothetical protein